MKLIAENTESTVVLRYEHKQSQRIAYQSEAQLEDALIEQLQAQGYEYLDIHTEEELIANLRKQLEKLNHIEFTDNEWKGFFRTKLANTGASIADKAELHSPIQIFHIQGDWFIQIQAKLQNHFQLFSMLTQ